MCFVSNSIGLSRRPSSIQPSVLAWLYDAALTITTNSIWVTSCVSSCAIKLLPALSSSAYRCVYQLCIALLCHYLILLVNKCVSVYLCGEMFMYGHMCCGVCVCVSIDVKVIAVVVIVLMF